MSHLHRARNFRVALAGAALAGTALAGAIGAGPATAGTPPASSSGSTSATWPAATSTRPGADGFISPPCAVPGRGRQQCFLAYRPQPTANHAMAAGLAARPAGLSAGDIRAAYRLPTQRKSDQTVAVSIAFDTPGLAKFLATYRKHNGLPPCTTASHCLRIVNQQGKATPLPPSGVQSGWDLEATLDVSMVSVACPGCRILVVEARDPSTANLAATERTAARLGAQVISNSYGTAENGLALAFRTAYQPPGHTVVVSSGDFGFTDAAFPADLARVTAVGGTTLTRAASRRGWHETVWKQQNIGAAGSGCSAWVAKPAWQHDTHCPMRTIADVSAVASRVPIFNSAYGGWVTVSGTSISAPLVAGIYGLAGNGATIATGRLYRHPGSFFDVTAGDNSFVFGFPSAQACGDYLCNARKNYDAPTGLGTPDGTRGF